MMEKAQLKIPAYEGSMELIYVVKDKTTGAMSLKSQATPDLCIPYDQVMDYQAFYMQMGLTLEPAFMHSVTFYATNASAEEQKNFPILYAGTFTQDSDGKITVVSRMGDIKTPLRPQDILLDYKTGKLLDGKSGEFDESRRCLERLFDFPTYAGKDNPPKKTFLYTETPLRDRPNETHLPTRAQVAAANQNVRNWDKGR